jgi:hypothetical protein
MFSRIKNEQHDNEQHVQHNNNEQYNNNEQQHNNDDNKTYLPQTDVVKALKLCPN